MTPEQKQKLSAALKAKWASGTRKPNPPETYAKSSATQLKGYAEGRLKAPRPWTPETAAKAAAARDQEKLRAHCSRVGKAKAGKDNPPGPSAKGPDNMWATYWELHGPNGELLRGMNLSELVRQNAHLFDAKDLNWNRAQSCRATKGLRQLFQTRRPAKSWKGWTAGLHDAKAPNAEIQARP